MVNILIVNPSVNMRLAAMEMKMYGANVKFAYSSDILSEYFTFYPV